MILINYMGEDELVAEPGRTQMDRRGREKKTEKKNKTKKKCTLQNGDIDKTTPFKVCEYTARRVIYLYTARTQQIQKRCCMMYGAILHKTSINSLLLNLRHRCLPCHGYSKHTASNNRPKAYPSCIYLLKRNREEEAEKR